MHAVCEMPTHQAVNAFPVDVHTGTAGNNDMVLPGRIRVVKAFDEILPVSILVQLIEDESVGCRQIV